MRKLLQKDLTEEESIRNDNNFLEELPLLRTHKSIAHIYVYCVKMSCIRDELFHLLTEDDTIYNSDIEASGTSVSKVKHHQLLSLRSDQKSVAPGVTLDVVEAKHPYQFQNQGIHNAYPPSDRDENQSSCSALIKRREQRCSFDLDDYYSDTLIPSTQTQIITQMEQKVKAALPYNVSRDTSDHNSMSEDSEIRRRIASPAASKCI